MRWLVCAAIAVTTATSAPAQVQPSRADIVERVRPSIVTIETWRKSAIEFGPFADFFGEKGKPPPPDRRREVSSGLIIDAVKGIVATADSSIRDAEELIITLADGRTVKGTPLGGFQPYGVGVLQIPPSAGPVPPFTTRTPRVGEPVTLVGQAYELGVLASAGIVGGIDRQVLLGDTVRASPPNLILDAIVNLGASGGVALDADGQVVGLLVGRFSNLRDPAMGYGIALRTEHVTRVVDAIVAAGGVKGGVIGLTLEDGSTGPIVTYLDKDSPAERAGIIIGDTIMGFAGRPMSDTAELAFRVALTPIGATVPISVQRGDKTLALTVTVEARPATEPPPAIGDRPRPNPRGRR